MEKLKDTLDNLSLTNDEAKRLTDAFKKDEFKKMFLEYAQELQDPENRRLYEEELAAMENERGMNVEFINPQSGHVLKTIQNGSKKIFINICQSDKIDKAECKRATNGKGGNWSIPHSFSPPREDIDKKHDNCLVYDVVFNPTTYEMGEKDRRFRQMLHDTALEGLEKTFKVTVDKVNFKILKMKMKGPPTATIIRNKQPEFEKKQNELDTTNDKLAFPYPTLPEETRQTHYKVNDTSEKRDSEVDSGVKEFTKPAHHIKYSNKFDITKFAGDNQSYHYGTPDSMTIEIKLPMLSSAKGIDLDIDRHNLKLSVERPVKYLLELKLTYPVIPDNGTAKFEKTKKQLIVILPIENKKLIEEVKFVEKSEKDLEEEPCSGVEEILGDDDEKEACTVHNEDLRETVDKKENDESDVAQSTINRKELNIRPRYDFRNNASKVFILFDIKNVKEDSCKFVKINSGVDDEEGYHQAHLVLDNVGQGGWINNYKVTLKFKMDLDKLNLSEICSVSVSKQNLIIKVNINLAADDLNVCGLSMREVYEESIKTLNRSIQEQSKNLYSWKMINDSLDKNPEYFTTLAAICIQKENEECEQMINSTQNTQEELNASVDDELKTDASEIVQCSTEEESHITTENREIILESSVEQDISVLPEDTTDLSDNQNKSSTDIDPKVDVNLKTSHQNFDGTSMGRTEPGKPIQFNCDLLFDLE